MLWRPWTTFFRTQALTQGKMPHHKRTARVLICHTVGHHDSSEKGCIICILMFAITALRVLWTEEFGAGWWGRQYSPLPTKGLWFVPNTVLYLCRFLVCMPQKAWNQVWDNNCLLQLRTLARLSNKLIHTRSTVSQDSYGDDLAFVIRQHREYGIPQGLR